MKYLATVNGQEFAVDVEPAGAPGSFAIVVNGRRLEADLQPTARHWLHSLLLDDPKPETQDSRPAGGRSYQVAGTPGEVQVEGRTFAVEVERDIGLARGQVAPAAAGPARLKAPIPGLVVAVNAQPGAEVHEGQALVIVEAMKMQMELKSPRSGHVAEVGVQPGQEVNQGQVLVVIGE